MNSFRISCCLVLLTVGTAFAQPTVKSVSNAGSRIPSGFPGYGLAGVTVQATLGGTTVDGIMVYVSASEVGFILPSTTPTGAGKLTLNNNGDTVTADITVVPAAFGIFTQSQTGTGSAAAFNVAGDGSTTLNMLTSPASTGQTVMLNGTGLGAITSDETQTGVTDTPAGTPRVFVGLKPATVVSASRGTCCTGIDAAYNVPQGVAGWDVIQFVVPDGVSGCSVPVAVQTGDKVSNFASIAVSNGGPCTDPGGINGGVLQNVTG